MARDLLSVTLEDHMAQQIPIAEVPGSSAFDTRFGWELRKPMDPERRETDVFVLSLSPGAMRQQIEDAWMEEVLAELGLSDLVPTRRA